MGIALSYFRVSPRNAEVLQRHPQLFHHFVDGNEAVRVPSRGFWKSLFGSKPAQAEEAPVLDVALEDRPEDDEGDADKAWNAIHYLLTGTAEGGTFPAAFILHGGIPLGDEDDGYGPARLFSPDEVALINDTLQKETLESFQSRYDGRAMDKAKVYPQIWARDGDEGFDYVWESFERLKDFVRTTRETNQHLLVNFC